MAAMPAAMPPYRASDAPSEPPPSRATAEPRSWLLAAPVTPLMLRSTVTKSPYAAMPTNGRLSSTMTMPATTVQTTGHHCRRTSDQMSRMPSTGRMVMASASATDPPGRSSQRHIKASRHVTTTLTLPRFMSTSTGQVIAATANVTQRTVGLTGIRPQATTSSASRPRYQSTAAASADNIVKGIITTAKGGE